MAHTPLGSGFSYPLGSDPITAGAAQIKALADDADRKIGCWQGGTASLTLANNQTVTKTVTFIAGRFTAAPNVVASAQHSNYIATGISITATSFTLCIVQYQAVAASLTTNVFWIARQG